jgi:hypothetical protein
MARARLTKTDQKAIALARQAMEEIRDRLQDEHDEGSEKWQASDDGNDALEKIEQITNAIDELEALEGDA